MNETRPHTLRAFDEERNALRAVISQMGGYAAEAFLGAIRCLVERDIQGAARIVEQDRRIDELDARAEELVLQMIARRAPMADDLREAVAAFKIASMIERIGDYAKSIAKRVPQFDRPYANELIGLLAEMAGAAATQVQGALDAFAQRDPEKAVAVCDSDKTIDEFYSSMFRSLLDYMTENPGYIGPATHLLFIAKNIERVGDQATNVAEMVYFASTGKQLEDRERGPDPAIV